jgi:hypothetical protein
LERVQIIALAETLTEDDLQYLETTLPSIRRGELVEDATTYEDILQRVDSAFEASSVKLTGTPYKDLLRQQSDAPAKRRA